MLSVVSRSAASRRGARTQKVLQQPMARAQAPLPNLEHSCLLDPRALQRLRVIRASGVLHIDKFTCQ